MPISSPTAPFFGSAEIGAVLGSDRFQPPDQEYRPGGIPFHRGAQNRGVTAGHIEGKAGPSHVHDTFTACWKRITVLALSGSPHLVNNLLRIDALRPIYSLRQPPLPGFSRTGVYDARLPEVHGKVHPREADIGRGRLQENLDLGLSLILSKAFLALFGSVAGGFTWLQTPSAASVEYEKE